MGQFPSTSLQAVLDTQRRFGWSDAQTLERCLTLLRTMQLREVVDERDAVEARLAGLGVGASDAQRIEVVADGLPVCWGYFGSIWLHDALVYPGRWAPAGHGRPLVPARPTPRAEPLPRRYGRNGRWTPWRICLATWGAMVAVAVVVTLLG